MDGVYIREWVSGDPDAGGHSVHYRLTEDCLLPKLGERDSAFSSSLECEESSGLRSAVWAAVEHLLILTVQLSEYILLVY